jgi:hypothetical protein
VLLSLFVPLADEAAGADAGYERSARSFRLPSFSIPYTPPLPSRRAAAVWASEPCWQDCTAQCGAHFQVCLRLDFVEGCNAQNTACNLRCQKACRLYGGPLVNWLD